MKLRFVLSSAILLASLPAFAAAEDIATFTTTLTNTDSTQLGRLSRNGIQQDWLGTENYPGVINAASSYYYQTHTFAAADFVGAPYVEISVFDTQNGFSLFTSAYAGTYDPASKGTGWLGDQGGSGNYLPTDGRYYDVILPAGDDFTLVINTSANAGLNDPLDIQISAYADTMYDDPGTGGVVTPEPASFVTLGTGLLSLAAIARRRVFGSR